MTHTTVHTSDQYAYKALTMAVMLIRIFQGTAANFQIIRDVFKARHYAFAIWHLLSITQLYVLMQ